MVHNIYTNDFHLGTNSISEPILLADDISVIISGRNFEHFWSFSDLVLSHTTVLFAANGTVVNLDKMNITKLITKNSAHSTVHIDYEEECIEKVANTRFLGLKIANHKN
jgi:hypothetical protein